MGGSFEFLRLSFESNITVDVVGRWKTELRSQEPEIRRAGEQVSRSGRFAIPAPVRDKFREHKFSIVELRFASWNFGLTDLVLSCCVIYSFRVLEKSTRLFNLLMIIDERGRGEAERRCGGDLTPNYVPHSIRELSTFLVLQSGRRSVAEPGGLQLAAKAAGVI